MGDGRVLQPNDSSALIRGKKNRRDRPKRLQAPPQGCCVFGHLLPQRCVCGGRAFALLPLLVPSPIAPFRARAPTTSSRGRLKPTPGAAERTTADGGGSACARGAGQSAEAQLRRGGGREARGRRVDARGGCVCSGGGGLFSSPLSAGSAIPPPPPAPHRPASTCGAARPPPRLRGGAPRRAEGAGRAGQQCAPGGGSGGAGMGRGAAPAGRCGESGAGPGRAGPAALRGGGCRSPRGPAAGAGAGRGAMSAEKRSGAGRDVPELTGRAGRSGARRSAQVARPERSGEETLLTSCERGKPVRDAWGELSEAEPR